MNTKVTCNLTCQFRAIILAGCLTTALASVASATILIYTPTGATASTQLAGDSRLAIDTVNGTGLQFATPATIESTAELPNHNQTAQDMWLTDGTTDRSGTIIFDLGSPLTFNRLYVWNYAEGGAIPDYLNRGASNVIVYADNTVNPITFQQNFIFDKATPSALTPLAAYNTPVDEYAFSTDITARYIRFDVLSSWGNPTSNEGPYVGLSEVRFGLNVIPEPSTVLLLCAGGLVVWSRRKQQERATILAKRNITR